METAYGGRNQQNPILGLCNNFGNNYHIYSFGAHFVFHELDDVYSFGVFHGDALWNIKIRFAKEVAKRAEKVQFHPSQKISHGRNGSLVMELRCRGHRELIWELLHPDWIGHVKIESPEGLQKEYLGQLDRAKTAV